MPPKRKTSDPELQGTMCKKQPREVGMQEPDQNFVSQDMFDTLPSASQFLPSTLNTWNYSNILTPSQSSNNMTQSSYRAVSNRPTFDEFQNVHSQDDISCGQPLQPIATLPFSQLSDDQLSQTGLPSHLVKLKKHAANALSARQSLSHSLGQPLFNPMSSNVSTSANNAAFSVSLPDISTSRSMPSSTITSAAVSTGAMNQGSSTSKAGDSIPPALGLVMTQMLDTMNSMSSAFTDMKKTMTDYMDTNKRSAAPSQNPTGTIGFMGFDSETNENADQPRSGQLPVVMRWILLQGLAPSTRAAYSRAWNEF